MKLILALCSLLAIVPVLGGCSSVSVSQSWPLDVTPFNVPEGRAIVVKVDPQPEIPWTYAQEAWVVNFDGHVQIYPIGPANGGSWLGALSNNINGAMASFPGDASTVGALMAK